MDRGNDSNRCAVSRVRGFEGREGYEGVFSFCDVRGGRLGFRVVVWKGRFGTDGLRCCASKRQD